jgi:hypothetical protein
MKMWIDWRNYGLTSMYCTVTKYRERKKNGIIYRPMKTLLTHFWLCDDAADKKLKKTTMATAGRFAALNSEEKDAVLDNINAKNTKWQTHTAVNLFREYLTEKNMDLDLENCSLDQTLSNFYMEMRNKRGDMYKKNPHFYRIGNASSDISAKPGTLI